MNREGAGAIEFAIAFPAIIALTMGILEISHITFAQSTLEGAVREASRRGVTGFIPSDDSREDYVRSRVIDMMDVFTLEGPVHIDTRVYENFADIGKPEPFSDNNSSGSYDVGECFTDVNQNGQWDSDMAIAGLGGPTAIVVYTAEVDLRLITPVFAWVTGRTSGTMQLSASTAVRNEPFNLVAGGGGSSPPTICGGGP